MGDQMKLLRADNLDKNYGTKQLLNDVSFLIKEKDRIGLIGINGTGKSTLMKILSGKDHSEKGSIDYPNDYKIGYLSQDTVFSEDISVLDAVFEDDTPVMKAIHAYEKALVDLAQDGENPAVQKAYEKAEEAMNKEDAWLAETSAKTILNKLGILFFR